MKVNRAIRAVAVTASMAMLALGLVGCQDDPVVDSQEPGSLGDMMEQMRGWATSDFERAVFDEAIETGVITQAQHEEAHSLFNQCMSDTGFVMRYEKYSNGLYKDIGPEGSADTSFDDDAFLKAMGECEKGTNVLIAEAYAQQLLNPEMVADNRTLAVQCLIDGGFVGKNYSVDDLEGDFSGGFANRQPFDPSDPTAELCLLTGGYVFVGGDS